MEGGAVPDMMTGDQVGQALADLLERSFREDNFWHGALWQHVTDLTVEQALWRPTPERHCVWEIVRRVPVIACLRARSASACSPQFPIV